MLKSAFFSFNVILFAVVLIAMNGAIGRII
jgi:hypothetical protein